MMPGTFRRPRYSLTPTLRRKDGDLDVILGTWDDELIYYESGYCTPKYACTLQGTCNEFRDLPATCDW